MSSVADPMSGVDSNNYEYSCNAENSSFSADKLCSSQSKIDSCGSNGEPCLRTPVAHTELPAVPPRNYQSNVANRIPVANNPYNAYNRVPFSTSRFPVGSYSPFSYSPTNPYYSYNSNMYGGYGMNGYNMNNAESRFIRAAEESTRPTFQAIESLTRAINSIAFMMESTFGSLNMSFQAILSVIENFSHARKFLKQFITSLLTLRIFHKFFLILVNLLRRMNILSEQSVASLSWQSAHSENTQAGVSIWPIFTFFGLMFGAPYIISKMLPCEETSAAQAEWNPSTDRHIPLIAVHDFQAGNNQELSFRQGQQLKMIPPEIMPPASPYWVFVADEKNQTGFVPRNHVAPA